MDIVDYAEIYSNPIIQVDFQENWINGKFEIR